MYAKRCDRSDPHDLHVWEHRGAQAICDGKTDTLDRQFTDRADRDAVPTSVDPGAEVQEHVFVESFVDLGACAISWCGLAKEASCHVPSMYASRLPSYLRGLNPQLLVGKEMIVELNKQRTESTEPTEPTKPPAPQFAVADTSHEFVPHPADPHKCRVCTLEHTVDAPVSEAEGEPSKLSLMQTIATLADLLTQNERKLSVREATLEVLVTQRATIAAERNDLERKLATVEQKLENTQAHLKTRSEELDAERALVKDQAGALESRAADLRNVYADLDAATKAVEVATAEITKLIAERDSINETLNSIIEGKAILQRQYDSERRSWAEQSNRDTDFAIEMQKRFDDLVEQLCAFITEEEGDDTAVEAIIIKWVKGLTSELKDLRDFSDRFADRVPEEYESATEAGQEAIIETWVADLVSHRRTAVETLNQVVSQHANEISDNVRALILDALSDVDPHQRLADGGD